MTEWFSIPGYLVFILCALMFVIILQGIVISKLLKLKAKIYSKIEWFRHFWSEFVIYVLATSVVGIFIASLVKRDNITLADINSWVSIILGFVALILGVISLYLSFYNVDQANKSQQEIKNTAKEISSSSTSSGWKCDVNGHWHFYDRSGHMVKNEWKKSGNNWYYLGADGEIMKDSIIEDSRKIYYVDKDGTMVRNTWVRVNGEKYYMTESGVAFMNGTLSIDGKEYMFENGCLKNDEK